MTTKHTPGLPRDRVFEIAEKYGAFEFGDAQGHKRLEFAANVIEAHERVRAAAHDLLAELIHCRAELAMAYASFRESVTIQETGAIHDDEDDTICEFTDSRLARIDALIARATGAAA